MNTSDKMIEELLKYVTPNSYVLEPSAGKGDLALALHHHGCVVDCIELNKKNYDFLKQVEGHNFNEVFHGDFLKLPIFYKEEYDYVVAVPPYRDNVDCQHIMSMYDIIKPNGAVITFTLPTWITGMYSNQIEFRKWLLHKNYELKLFPDEESYLSCPKMLLIIRK